MKNKIVAASLSLLAAFAANLSFEPKGLAEAGDSGLVNGANVSDFLGSGADVDRDAMDRAAEMENRKVYLDQDPKTKANVSAPVGSGQGPGKAPANGTSKQAAPADNARTTPTIVWKGDKLANTNKPMKGSAIGRFFRTVGDVLTPNWLIDFGLGPDDDTDSGPDNDNKNY